MNIFELLLLLVLVTIVLDHKIIILLSLSYLVFSNPSFLIQILMDFGDRFIINKLINPLLVQLRYLLLLIILN